MLGYAAKSAVPMKPARSATPDKPELDGGETIRALIAGAAGVFRPITGSRAFTEVVDQITYGIRSGTYPPGSRLPHIDALARAMKVSRPTVGEALRVLSDAGIVEVRRGVSGGVIVVTWRVPNQLLRLSAKTYGTSLVELVEARRPIEMELAVLAAERGTSTDFEDLAYSIRLLERSLQDPDEWFQINNLFHYTMGRAARSPALARCQHEIIEQISVVLDGRSLAHYTGPEAVIDMHTRTLDALKSRSAQRVRTIMDEHLGELESFAPKFDQLAARRAQRARRSATGPGARSRR